MSPMIYVFLSCVLLVVSSGHAKSLASPSTSLLAASNSWASRKRPLDLPELQNAFSSRSQFKYAKRPKRTSEYHITECIHMGSSEGVYYHKATTPDSQACGAYFFSDPDQNIEIHFNYVDVSCDNSGGISVVDGWELNGEFFPSPEDHSKPLHARQTTFCGQKKIKQVFISSQNAALIRYRMPSRGSSFSFTVRFIKNPTPCNVLFQDTEGVYTLRNYGKRSNCSISTMFPAAVKVAALNVGVTSVMRNFEVETGTIHKVRHKCQKRGLEDFVQIGGSTGLDNSHLQVADSVCGLDSKAGKHLELIACGTTTIRLVSTGSFDNSVTVAIREMNEEDINGFMSVLCDAEDEFVE